ncbi:MAG: tetratricopeptide repeat protein [Kofleriaceae bacterium]|nr:tetratricopeptide repeat protein [Kofleriaceae bacterium]
MIAAAALVAAGTGGAVALSAARSPQPCAPGPAPLAYDATAIRLAFIAMRPDAAAEASRALAALEAWRVRAGELRTTACRAARIDATESSELFDLRMACVARSSARMTALAGELAKPTRELVDTAQAAIASAADLSVCSSSREALTSLREPVEPAARVRYHELRRELASAQGSRAAGRYTDAARAADAIARAAAAAGLHAIEAEALQLAGESHDSERASRAAQETWVRALVAAEAAGDERLRAALYLELASVENKLDRRADAERWIAQARALVDRLQLADLAPSIDYHEGLAALWRDDYAAAVPLLTKALEAHERSGGDAALTVRMLEALGLVEWKRGNTPAAEQALTRALDLGTRVLGERHPALLQPLFVLASIALVAGKLDQAEALARRHLAIAEQHAGPEGTLLVHGATLLAVTLGESGRGEEAIPLLDRALASFALAVGEDRAQYATLLSLHGHVLTDLGRFEPALVDEARAVAIIRKQLGPDALDLATALEAEGRTLQGLRRHDDAIAAYAEAGAIRDRSKDDDPGQRYYPALGIGLNELDAGRPERAIPHLERAVSFRVERTDQDPVELADAKLGLARALLAAKRDRARATRLLREIRTDLAGAETGQDTLATADQLLAELGGP